MTFLVVRMCTAEVSLHDCEHMPVCRTNVTQCETREYHVWFRSTKPPSAQCIAAKRALSQWLRADFIPALSWDWPIMPGKVMQGKPEGGGSLGNGLLHSTPLPRRRMNQRPQAFPTLLHCPDSGQHHNPPDHLKDRRRRAN
jgi:hypothetical protein